MKAHVKLEGDVLEITFTGVQDSDRGRMANIEICLLRVLNSYRSEPWVPAEAFVNCEWKGYAVKLIRGDSTRKDYETARNILKGFALDV